MGKPKPTEADGLFLDGELAEAPGPLAVEALSIWNAIAPGAGWPEARFLTASRRAAIRRAIPDYGGLAGWKAHLATAATSDFLTGKSRRGPDHVNWRPDLDWFLKPANVVKILENKYNGVAPSASVAKVAPANRGTDWRGRLERYRRGAWWHKQTKGPRPEDPGPHLAPVEMIEQWREKHGIVVAAVRPVETRETRLAASIVSYRRLGNHARANAIEEELAALEGRPPVLVPHPSVAGHNKPSEAKTGPAVDPRGRPPGPITDIEAEEPPPWDAIPEGDEAMAEP